MEPLFLRTAKENLAVLRMHGIHGTRGFELLRQHKMPYDKSLVINVSDQLPLYIYEYLSEMGVQIMEWCQASGYWTLERLLQACLTIDKWLDTGPVRAFRLAIS
jgi:hypothetical protein